MAVKIRLTRCGRKKRPFYRVVAAESSAKRDGRFLEILGTYDPLKDPFDFKINTQRLGYWLGQGAQTSGTVGNLLKGRKA
ncbi:MAG: 30S ribosomal protein S16 [Dissulfurimicrobium sp.]|uniref:30S ribosomal protein S16 n=1 Tax=Dissulfurimicrobium TaxID=1769732 RepID=UPI001EDC5EBE|nr:30S ribosomal protein S16 [Dissulfurimicrobium hydrothermale]UKL13425.1 30S ribosomal protein S16 [Dissulfurimicrobium hydrothermale]